VEAYRKTKDGDSRKCGCAFPGNIQVVEGWGGGAREFERNDPVSTFVRVPHFLGRLAGLYRDEKKEGKTEEKGAGEKSDVNILLLLRGEEDEFRHTWTSSDSSKTSHMRMSKTKVPQ